MEVICAINFVGDTDGHGGNVGLVDHGNYYSFVKIDHGFSFNYSYERTHSLDSIRSHLKNFYNTSDLESIGFEQVYQGITNVNNLDFSAINNLVDNKIGTVKSHMQAIEVKDLDQYYFETPKGNLGLNLAEYKTELLLNLKSQHNNFTKIANFMDLEQSIIDHDSAKLSNLMSKGIDLDQSFKPFYNPTYLSTNSWNCETKSVTGRELVQKYWPSLLDFNDVICNDNNNLKFSASTQTAPNFIAAPVLQDIPAHLMQPEI